MIPFAIPDLTGNEARYLQECISSTYVSSVGPFVTQFEKLAAELSGAKNAVATASGTTGLHAALTALGVSRDDLVVLPTFTFIGSANAISHAGASPWLFDVNPDTWTLDPIQLRAGLEKFTQKTDRGLIHIASGRKVAAIMPVHVLGIPADMDPIVKIAAEFEIPVLADGAAAMGTLYKGRKIAETGANLTVFSFNGNKTVTAGGGGAVVGNDETLVKLVHHLTTTARVGADYDHDRIGFNYRLTNLQAAVGCAQLERLANLVAAKRRIQKTYADELGSLAGVTPFPDPEYGASACWFSGVFIDRPGFDLNQLRKFLRDREIDARPFWKPIHLQAPYANTPAMPLPVTDSIWNKLLTLPCSTALSPEDQGTVISAVKEALK